MFRPFLFLSVNTMTMAKELDIAQANRRQVGFGDEKVASPSVPVVEERDSLVTKTARSAGYKKTMDSGRALQDKYRESHGLDQFNRPVKRAVSRSSSRR